MDSTEISILSAIIAFISAIIAYCSYRVSKKALRIEENRENRYLKSLNFELVKGIHLNLNSDSIVYIFIISISNSSSSSKSLNNITLKVLYTDQHNYERQAFFAHDPTIAEEQNLKDYEFAPLNPYFDPNETNTLGFIFKVNREIIKDNYVDIFNIEFKDNNGEISNVQSILTTSYELNEGDNEFQTQ